MEEMKDSAKELTENIKGLAETYYDLAILTVTKKVTDVAAGGLLLLIIITFSSFIFLFLAVAFAWWLGDVLDSRIGGFLLGAGIFLFIVVLLFLLRRKTLMPYLQDIIIKRAYD